MDVEFDSLKNPVESDVVQEQNGDNKEDYEGEEEYDDGYDGGYGGNYRGGRGMRNNYRNNRSRGGPGGWGPPPRFRGRGYGPTGPPMRGSRPPFFRGRGGPRYGGNFDPSWGPMGPPPGMMNGPPPFGPPPFGPGGPMGPPSMMPPFAPPGMVGPPGMMSGELWVETKADDNKSYYYHARTRETTWTRPEGPNVKVITQAEMESMAASGPMMMPPNLGMMPPNMMASNEGGSESPSSQTDLKMDAMDDNSDETKPPGIPGFGPGPIGFPGPGGGGFPPNQFNSWPPAWPPPGMLGQQPTPGGDRQSPSNTPEQLEPPGINSSGSQGMPNLGSGNQGMPNLGSGNQGMPNLGNGNQGMPNLGNGSQGMPNLAAGMPNMGVNNQLMQHLSKQREQSQPNMAQQMSSLGQGMPNLGQGMPNLGQGMPNMGQGMPNLAQQMTNVAQQMPNMGMMAGMMPPGLLSQLQQQNKQPDQNKDDLKSPPADLEAAAKEWTTHRAPDGRPYYYHAKNQESVWEKPQPLRDLEAWNASMQKSEEKKSEYKYINNEKDIIEIIDEDSAEPVRQSAASQQQASVAAAVAAAAAAAAAAEKEKAEREKQEKEKAEKEKAATTKAKSASGTPITNTPIKGTPWCVVWTTDLRVFFYNPTEHVSVWAIPEQLVGRADVEKAVSEPPAVLLAQRKKEAAEASSAAKANGATKRSAEDSSSDSDAEPKKAKQETAPTTTSKPGVIDAGADAAIEAEVRAARERAVVPLDQRVKLFRQMLEEKQVSAFSTWEKELQKIVFDERYLMLTSKERKQVFDKYVKERAEEELKEKRRRLKQKKDDFRALCESAKLHGKSSFSEFSSKYAKEDRFRGIEKVRERESLFNEYILELRKREKDEKEKKREQAKKEFIAMLKEKDVDRHARWSEAKKKVESEARYKAVDSSTAREDHFREYCRMVKEDEKKKGKDKEKESSRSSSKKEKKDKDKEKEKKSSKKEKDKEKEKEKSTDEEDEDSSAADEAALAKDRAARAEASLKEREKEVQRVLATSLRDRDKEREFHKRDEAVQHFNALLADLVRNADLTWREAKKQLKKDHRYELAELLGKEEKERLFTAHTTTLGAKRRDKFRELLTEQGVTLTAHWRDVKKSIANDPRAAKYSSQDKCEREFRDFQKDKLATAKVALRQLLQETKSLTHETAAKARESKKALQTVHDTLKHDARYLVLEHIAEEREQIIIQFLDELEKKGPPPPPTASEPTRRK